jgi:hypothetical protein
MTEASEDMPEPPAEAPPRARRWPRWLFVLGGVLVLMLGGLWLAREEIADRIVARQLKDMGLPATYQVEEVGPDRQVLRNVVVGDPKQPDFTAEEVELSENFANLRLVKPRLYGTYKGGKLSFGSLDKLLFTDSKEPFRLPALFLTLEDGRALIDSDYGPVGIKAEGKGALRSGFAGTLAAIAPELRLPGCRAQAATLFGKVAVSGEVPRFAGPLRLQSLNCPDRGLKLAEAGLELDATFAKALDGAEAKGGLKTGRLAYGDVAAGGLGGSLDLVWSKQQLSATYDLAGTGIAAPQLAAARLHGTGTVRAFDGFARIEGDGAIDGSGIRAGRGIDATLASAESGAAGSFAAPMLGQIRSALAREGRSGTLAGNFIVRQTGKVLNLIVPRAQLTGTSGAGLLTVSRLQYVAGQTLAPIVSGNFATGGAGLPRLSGRMEQRGGGLQLRMTMPEYRGGGGRVALPELVLVQARNGALGFSGRAQVSGPLPGGAVEGLDLPIDGTWAPGRGLAVWRGCVPLSFRRLAYANLTLDRRSLTLCSGGEGAILRSDARGTRFAAGAPALSVAGRLGTTPIRLTSGPVGFAVPGTVKANKLDVVLGAGEGAARFQLADLTARIGKDISGRFERTDAKLTAVPLDLFAGSGAWRYANGRLSLSEGAFRLEDRQQVDRFRPLISRGAELALVNNKITATATMFDPGSGREVTSAAIVHDLGNGRGSADLAVPGIRFDKDLQPDTLTPLALGVIANAEGTVRGSGRIDWDPDRVTSTGRFTTDRFDFAALFGPVKGVSGEVVFTDLIGLVTAPDQRLKIASINPGIEAMDGVLSFELKPDGLLLVNGASWPFMNGELRLSPTRMVLGAEETRRFTLEVDGVDAATFVQRLELSNIAATGTFDGVLPLVFDKDGGRIERGLLVSRAPGGNLSYVGELSYQDLSTMGNFAFDALKSLDYKAMRVELDGSLSDEIVTRLAFEGIGQGKTARQNFLTKQVSRLPIQFRVNIRAPFFSMFSSFKSLYDPSAITDPRKLGLFDKQPSDSDVKPPVSETKP